MRRRRVGDLDHHDLTRLRALLLAGLDHHVLVQPAIVGRDQGHAILDQHATDQARRAPLQHFGNHALLAAAAVDADHAGQHPVAVQHAAHLLRRKVQVVATFVRAQETVALGIGQHAAGDQVELAGRRIAAAPAQQQLGVAHHRGEPLAQRLEIGFVVKLQRLGDARFGQQFAAIFQQGEDRLAARDRTRVTLRLAFGLGIAQRIRLARAPCGTGGGALFGVRRFAACLWGLRGLAPARLRGSFSGHQVSLWYRRRAE